MEIRTEQPTDIREIHNLTAAAFAPKNFSDGTEPALIDDLRTAGELTLSLVAVIENKLAGHVAFSAIKIESAKQGWYGLGPISVWPNLQRTGIGSALIYKGLSMLRTKGALGCALTGDPGYYSRFGFISDGNLHFSNVPDSHVQWLAFDGSRPSGQLEFSPAFGE